MHILMDVIQWIDKIWRLKWNVELVQGAVHDERAHAGHQKDPGRRPRPERWLAADDPGALRPHRPFQHVVSFRPAAVPRTTVEPD